MATGIHGEAIVPPHCPMERFGLDGDIDVSTLPLEMSFHYMPDDAAIEVIASIGTHDDEGYNHLSLDIKDIPVQSALGRACMETFTITGPHTVIGRNTDVDAAVAAVRERLLQNVRSCTLREQGVCAALGPAALRQALADTLLSNPDK